MHPHLRTLYADRFFVFVGVQCVLSAGQDGIGRQSLQVWTCWRAVSVHSYFLQRVIRLFAGFERLTYGRTKEFLLLLRICSQVRVYGMCIVEITKTEIR